MALCLLVTATAAAVGPDVTVGDITLDTCQFTPCHHYGPVGTIHGYSIGTTSCNIGDALLDWISNTNKHPVIAQSIYRLKDGRIEQLGIGWVKHGFCALQQSLCQTCNPAPGTGCRNRLGIGCSDPYSAELNGQQTGLGPRFQVNAKTGVFPYPFSSPGGATGNAIFKRIQVEQSELQTLNSYYFGEAEYIHPDDAANGNGLNNVSYRRFFVNPATFLLTYADPTVREKPAIFAWRDFGFGPGMPDNSVQLVSIDVPGDGRFWAGGRASDNGNGTWHYEYAVFNLNSDRGGGSFSVPRTPYITITNQGFRDVVYHSGEPYDNTNWTQSTSPSDVLWTSPQTADVNTNSNALRWGTMYNFRFDANQPPTNGTVTLGLFKIGSPASMAATLPVPAAPTCSCNGDLNGDLALDGNDIPAFVSMMVGASAPNICADLAAPIGTIDNADLTSFANLLLISAGCGS